MSAKNSRTKDLKVRFLVDSQKGIKNMRAFKNELKDFNNITDKNKKGGGFLDDFFGGKGGTKKIPTVGSMLDGLKSKILSLNPAFVVAAAGIAIFAAGIGQMVSAGRQAEDAITRLYVMHGKNRTQALKDYNEALKYSVATPFDPRDVVEGSKVLTAYGAERFGDKKQYLKLVGDMAAYSGQSMGEAATALMRGDLALLDKYGLQGRQAYNLAKKKGGIGTEGFQAEFIKQMSSAKNLWNGMAEEMAGTVSGLTSTIAGNAGLMWTYLSGAAEGEGTLTFWSSLKSILKDISDGFGQIVEFLKPMLVDIGAAIGGVFDAIWSVIKAIWAGIKPFAMLVGGVIYGAFRAILKVIIYIAKFIKWIVDWIAKGVKWYYKWIDETLGISNALKSIVEWFDKAVLLLKMLWTFTMRLIDPVIDKLKGLFYWLKKIFGDISDYFSEMARNLFKMTDKHPWMRKAMEAMSPGATVVFKSRDEAQKRVNDLIRLSQHRDPEIRNAMRQQRRWILEGSGENWVREREALHRFGLLEQLKNMNNTTNTTNNQTININQHGDDYPSYIKNKKKGDLSGSMTPEYAN